MKTNLPLATRKALGAPSSKGAAGNSVLGQAPQLGNIEEERAARLPVGPRRARSPTEESSRRPRFVARLHRDLDRLSDLWRAFEANGACTAFQKLAWVNAINEHLVRPECSTLIVVEITDLDQNRALMLLPMVRIERRTYSAIEGPDFGVSDYIAPLLAPGAAFTPDEAREVWKSIKSLLPRVDLIRLYRIPQKIFSAANPLVSLPSCRPMETAAFGVQVQGDPDTLIQRLCRKSTFRDLAKFRRRLERHGKILLKEPESPAEVDGILDAMIAQRRQRFREIGRSDLLASDRIVAFYRAAAHQGLEGGPVRIFGLFVNDQCVGTAYGLVHCGAFHLLIQTMDGSEELRNCSPGLQVTADVMKWSLQQGLTYFDFTIGNLPYKTEFGAAASALYELNEAQTTRGHVVLCLARAATASKAWIRQHPWLFALLRGPWHAMRRQLAGLYLTATPERSMSPPRRYTGKTDVRESNIEDRA